MGVLEVQPVTGAERDGRIEVLGVGEVLLRRRWDRFKVRSTRREAVAAAVRDVVFCGACQYLFQESWDVTNVHVPPVTMRTGPLKVFVKPAAPVSVRISPGVTGCPVA